MKKVIILFLLLTSALGFSQVTKSSISGTVKSAKGDLLSGAKIEVVHVPTGTKYFSNADFTGSYSIPSIRPGGPYTVKISFMGMKEFVDTDITAPLGSNVTVNASLKDELNALDEVVVVVKKPGSVFSKGRTGASQSFSTREITAVPTSGSRSISNITKYNSSSNNSGSFNGQDPRLNNFTVDGSSFNDGFGLGTTAQAGGRSGSTAISLDAIEQVQINIAPFDVRQTGFTGTGINAVTRSGTNNYEGSVYGSTRSNKKEFIGTKAGKSEIENNTFDEQIYGARFGLPIIKNKLFFFGNFEILKSLRPGTNWVTSDKPTGTQISAPTSAQMQGLSDFLLKNYKYETGPFAGFNAVRSSKKFLARLDYNINDNNVFTARYIHHDSFDDAPISNSDQIGFGGRQGNQNSLSFKNSGYIINDNSRSIALELDSKLSNSWSNNLIVGYDIQNEDRDLQGGGFFPVIDIKNGVPNTAPLTGYSVGTANFISAGLDPFTQGNLLNYTTFHVTNNLTKKLGNHTFLVGMNYERFKSNNSFYPGLSGGYVFNSLDEFYLAANESLGTNGLGTAPSTINLPVRTQLRYSVRPGGDTPIQVLKSNKLDLYLQDEVKFNDLKVTLGLRATRMSFNDTALENTNITNLSWLNGEKYDTGRMPDTQYLFEPRIGFNLNVKGESKTQIRGGTGIFTGRPPMVYLSNAIGNNGVLTALVDVSDANVAPGILSQQGYGFTPNPAQFFTPKNAFPEAKNLDLAFTDAKFKFPQVWKSTVAIDQKLPYGFIGSIEGIFGKNINEIFYYNANLAAPVGTLNGSISGDNRPLYANNTNGVRINNIAGNAIVLSNSNQGYFYSTSFKLDYTLNKGLWGSISYTRSEAKDLMSPGSTAGTTFNNLRSVNGNNDVQLANSNNYTPHRVVGLVGYKIDYGKKVGASTSISLGYVAEKSSPFSYTYQGNLNGDGISGGTTGNGNDLLFVPKKASDLRFTPITQNIGGSTVTLYTVAQQEEAFDKYIEQDSYLRTKRGQYVDRNANVLPILQRLDLTVTQDFCVTVRGKKNSFQFRADIINFGNLINQNWGVSYRATAPSILIVRDSPNPSNQYVPGYNLNFQTNEQGKRFLAKDTFVKNAGPSDVWQAQFSLRYTFGN